MTLIIVVFAASDADCDLACDQNAWSCCQNDVLLPMLLVMIDVEQAPFPH